MNPESKKESYSVMQAKRQLHDKRIVRPTKGDDLEDSDDEREAMLKMSTENEIQVRDTIQSKPCNIASKLTLLDTNCFLNKKQLGISSFFTECVWCCDSAKTNKTTFNKERYGKLHRVSTQGFHLRERVGI